MTTMTRGVEPLLRSLLYLGGARVGVMAMNLVATSRMARALGADNFGINSFAIAYVAYFLIVVNLGFETFVTREIAVDRGRLRELAGSVVTMRLLLAVAAGIVLFATLPLLHLSAAGRSVVLIQGFGLLTSAIGLTCVYQGLQRMRVVAWREFMASFVSVVGILWLVHSPDDLVTAAYITSGTQFAINLTILVHFVSELGLPRIRLPGRDDIQIVRQSMVYFWSLLMIAITYNIHIVLLGLIGTDTEVGFFAVSWRLFIVTIAIPNLIAALFMPRIAHGRSHTAQRGGPTVLFMQTIILCALPVTMLGCALTPQILWVLFGPAFMPASRTVMLLLLNGLVVSLNIGIGTWMTAVGRQGVLLRIVTTGAAIGVALNLLLIPLLGDLGAALATLADEVVILAMFLRACPHLFDQETRGYAIRCAISAAPAAVIAGLIAHLPAMQGADLAALIAGGTAGGVIYIMVLHLLRVDIIRFFEDFRRL